MEAAAFPGRLTTKWRGGDKSWKEEKGERSRKEQMTGERGENWEEKGGGGSPFTLCPYWKSVRKRKWREEGVKEEWPNLPLAWLPSCICCVRCLSTSSSLSSIHPSTPTYSLSSFSLCYSHYPFVFERDEVKRIVDFTGRDRLFGWVSTFVFQSVKEFSLFLFKGALFTDIRGRNGSE